MISKEQKNSRYERLHKQAEQLLSKSPSLIAQFATINALLYHKVDYIFWIGFYLIRDKKLIVSAYQGPLACQELNYPNGICWNSVIDKKSIIVPYVSKAKNHIACDSRTRSELVIPLYNNNGEIAGVFDIDSDMPNAFDEIDEKGLHKILELIDII